MPNEPGPDPHRRRLIANRARLLAASGRYVTLDQIEEACIGVDLGADEVHSVLGDAALRREIAAFARKAHGVGGPMTE